MNDISIQLVVCDKKVYWVSEVCEGIQYAVAAKNRNQAKLLSNLYVESDVPYIELKAKLARSKDGKPITTHKQGEFGGVDIINHGMAWWECPECSSTHFISGKFADQYICMVCGHKGNIPFAE